MGEDDYTLPSFRLSKLLSSRKAKYYLEEKSAIRNFKKFKAETAKNIPALNLLDLISFFDRCRGDVRSATLVG